MKSWMSFSAGGRGLVLAVLLGLAALMPRAWAHGGDDHGGAPAANGAGLPRVEAHSEAFELVGQLDDKELSLLIDRYASNEPVLGAKVEVESGGIQAVARFHADHGDYAVEDERLLALLRQPGEHALVFTVTLGAESDLLDGLLRRPMAVAPPEHDMGGGLWRALMGVIVVALLAVAVYVFLQRRARARGLPKLGGQA